MSPPPLFRLFYFRVPSRAAAMLGIAATLLLTACGREADDAAKKKAAAAGPQAVPVVVKHVQPQRVPIVLEAVGQAEGSREVEVRARVSGILEKRLFNEGAAVRAGAVLFVIDRAPYEIAVAQARATLSQERARQELAQRETERLKTLAQQRAISQREFEESQSSVKQIAAAIEGAQARLAEAQLNLSYTQVRAPISGITGRAARSEGSLVTANTDASLLTTLTQVQPVWVRFSLAEADFERIRGNEKRAQVKLLDQNGVVAAPNGRLNFAGTSVDAKLGTVQLRAEFSNPGERWLPGQFVKVQILAGEQDAMLVPQAAVMQTEQTRAVWVVGPDGKALMRPVQTAGWVGTDWLVTGGLNPGEPVIVDNLIKMRPGVAVQPRPADAAAQQGAAPTPAAATKATSP
jgi:membrane fusion protein (multidrug efflux system)